MSSPYRGWPATSEKWSKIVKEVYRKDLAIPRRKGKAVSFSIRTSQWNRSYHALAQTLIGWLQKNTYIPYILTYLPLHDNAQSTLLKWSVCRKRFCPFIRFCPEDGMLWEKTQTVFDASQGNQKTSDETRRAQWTSGKHSQSSSALWMHSQGHRCSLSWNTN